MKQRSAIRVGGAGRWAFGVCLMLFGLCVSAQPGPPGKTETQRVLEAHQAIESAQIDVRYAQYFSFEAETEFAVAEYRVLLDRKSQRVRVDRPGYTLICDGKDILLIAEALPGRHLRMPMGETFSYERLLEVFPDLGQPVPPALVLLLAESPVVQLSGAQTQQLTRIQTPAAIDQSLYLSLPIQQGTAQLVLDAQSRRITSMRAQIDPALLAGSDLQAVRMHYDIVWSKVGEALDDAEFELDLKKSQEMTTLAAFLSPGGGGGGAGPGGQGGGAGNTLIGLPLPEIELDLLGGDEKVKLSDLSEGVVVLECFATWSKTSVLDLPALSDFKAWCKEKKHDVKVYGIAVGEQADHMTKWMDALEKTAKKEVDLPILMDTATDAAVALRLPTVPRTLIIVDGRIAEVYGGVKPTYLDDLKKGLPGWLEKVEKSEDE